MVHETSFREEWLKSGVKNPVGLIAWVTTSVTLAPSTILVSQNEGILLLPFLLV
jgi:hypothetical protein